MNPHESSDNESSDYKPFSCDKIFFIKKKSWEKKQQILPVDS